jgi:competence protein ComEA
VDQLGQWRVVAAEPEEPTANPPANAGPGAPSPRGIAAWQLAVALGGLVVGVVGAAIWITLPQPAVTLDAHAAAVVLTAGSPDPSSGAGAATASDGPEHSLVIDVEGAVTRPGVVTLPAGSRVGDAISAAGGYSGQIDIAAAAAQLNLAQPLKDGEKVHVPARGEATVAVTAAPAAGGSAAPLLIDINHASADELDTLPGVGPVTAGKIITAREEAPFTAPDELVSRGVLGQSTYDKLSSLITVMP